MAEVYLAMTGGQMDLFDDIMIDNATKVTKTIHLSHEIKKNTDLPVILATIEEQHEHQLMLDLIAKTSNGKCLWPNN